jgi:hypothetical protein
MSSICIYSLGSYYKNYGTIIRYELLKKDNIMIVGGSHGISQNLFTKEKEEFINRKYREHMAAY